MSPSPEAGEPQRREVRSLRDLAAVCIAAANEFVSACSHAVDRRSVFRVALAGGSTPRHLHETLTQSPFRERISWNQIDFYFGDERAVPPTHPDSNYRMAHDTLFAKLGIAEDRVHRMMAERADLDAAARDYEARLANGFGLEAGSAPPRFDLILLGMGADAHTASLFPGTSALGERTRWVAANPVPQLGCSRMTVTYPLLNRARRIVFLVAGEAKADALAGVLEGPEDPSRLPAQGVRPTPGSLLYLVDRGAGKRLDLETSAQ